MSERNVKKKQVIQDFYSQTEDEVFNLLETKSEGLSEIEVNDRLELYGTNELEGTKKKSLLQKFFEQFKDLMILILLVAAGVSAMVPNAEGHREWVDALIILSVVIINAVMGVIQEAKAEQAIEALREMSTPNANVFRNGHSLSVSSTELVPGDLVLLEAGDVVPAIFDLSKRAH